MPREGSKATGFYVRLAALVLAAAATGAAHGRLSTPGHAARGDLFVPRPEFARLLAFGFDTVVSDFFWIQAVQVVGAGNGYRDAQLIGRLVDVVTFVNPWTSHPYRMASVFLTGSPEQVREANRLLRRGIAYHPDDWRNRFYLGFNRFFYLGEYEEAADALEGAIGLSGGPPPYGGPAIPDPPPYLSRLVARLRAHAGDLETAGAFLAELVRNAPDARIRAQYEEALVEIETEQRARFLDAARERFRARHGRDIASLEELVRPPRPVLRALPPEPHGAGWTIDAKSGRIVSRHYGRRYEPHAHAVDRERRSRWGVEG